MVYLDAIECRDNIIISQSDQSEFQNDGINAYPHLDLAFPEKKDVDKQEQDQHEDKDKKRDGLNDLAQFSRDNPPLLN